jgi:hypothetical protein
MNSYPFISEKYTSIIIPLDRAKEWLEMDIDGYEERDHLINDCIQSAVGSAESDLNFQLGVSTYTWNTDCLPTKMRDTFYVQSITSIKIGDTLVDAANYRLVKTSERESIILWKSVPKVSDICEVIFTAGIPEGKIPADLLQAVRARLAEHYKREDGVAEKKTLSDKLLTPFIIPYAG